MKTNNATPGPWKISKLCEGSVAITAKGKNVASLAWHYCDSEEKNFENFPNAEANAEFIVRAVNNFEGLLEACKIARDILREIAPGKILNLEQAIANAEK